MPSDTLTLALRPREAHRSVWVRSRVRSADVPTPGEFPTRESTVPNEGVGQNMRVVEQVQIWGKRVPVPSNFQGLYRCEYEGDEIGQQVPTALLR